MKQIGVKEERIPRLHLHIDQFKAFQNFVDTPLVCSGLIVGQHVLDAPKLV
jgi:hypothetical protein